MDVSVYLDRIGYTGPTDAGPDTLRGLVRAHIEAVPFENLDVQLRRPVDLTVEHAYDKLVVQRRGGWCYEQNGLFGWVLTELGFDVRRVSGGVRRDHAGDGQLGTHLVLLVDDHLVDVGFGSTLTAPLPLEDGSRHDPPFTVGLERIAEGYWRFYEFAEGGEPFTFDFLPEPADEAVLQRQCDRQWTDPESPFRKRLVVQMRDGDAHVTLRGTTCTRVRADGTETHELTSPAELVATLRDVFGLDVPAAAELWPR